jgi:hypothetical protein
MTRPRQGPLRSRLSLSSLQDKTALYIAWIAHETSHLRFIEPVAAGREDGGGDDRDRAGLAYARFLVGLPRARSAAPGDRCLSPDGDDDRRDDSLSYVLP